MPLAAIEANALTLEELQMDLLAAQQKLLMLQQAKAALAGQPVALALPPAPEQPTEPLPMTPRAAAAAAAALASPLDANLPAAAGPGSAYELAGSVQARSAGEVAMLSAAVHSNFLFANLDDASRLNAFNLMERRPVTVRTPARLQREGGVRAGGRAGSMMQGHVRLGLTVEPLT